MTKNTILRALLLGGLIGPWAGGCATEPVDSAQPDNQGQISLDVLLAPGIQLDTVAYTITGPAQFSRTGSVGVGNSSTVSAVIGGIPLGTGYQITLRSGISGGGGDCSGSATFDIRPGAVTPVSVHMTCVLAPGTGSVLVNGTLNVCPRIDELDATPAEVAFGSSIALQAKAIDVDHVPAAMTFRWTATSGSVGDTAATAPTFTCTQIGRATITVAVSDGDAACSTQQSVDVVCTEPAPQTPIKHVIVLIGVRHESDASVEAERVCHGPVRGRRVLAGRSADRRTAAHGADSLPGDRFARPGGRAPARAERGRARARPDAGFPRYGLVTTQYVGGTVQKFDDLPAAYRKNLDAKLPLDGRAAGSEPPMTEQQVEDLICFLRTLTDEDQLAAQPSSAACRG